MLTQPTVPQRGGSPVPHDVSNRANGRLITVHTSGHILADDIAKFVQSITPTTVIPVHTFEPQQFSEHFANVRVLNDGEPHTID